MKHAQKLIEAQTYTGDHIVVQPLRVPSPVLVTPHEADQNDVASQLATQNKLSHDRSVDHLARWFPGYDFEAAAQTTDDRRFVVLNIGAELHEFLKPIETIEFILATRDFIGSQLRFSGGPEGQADPNRVLDRHQPQVRRPILGPLAESLSQQWTTIVNNIDQYDERIATVSEHLERVYGAATNTNVYISFGQAEGFGAHWDSHDTIIVPASGSKMWKVFEPATLSPMRPWIDDSVSTQPVWEGVIEPGMCLIIPRGWGHEVSGSDDLSIHYTVGVNRPTVNNVVERLVVESGYSPIVRADLPYDPDGEVLSYDRSIHDEPEALADVVTELATPELVKRSIATYRARLPVRMFPKLYDLWTAVGANDWQGVRARMAVPAGVQVMPTPDGAFFAFNNATIGADADAVKMIIALADAQPHTLEELPLADDSELQKQILRELAFAGLIDLQL